MKNYDEITNDLLKRRDRYAADQRKKRKVMLSAASLGCVGLIALLGIGIWQSGTHIAPQTEQTAESAGYQDVSADSCERSEAKNSLDESKEVSSAERSDNNKIIVHSINSIPSYKNLFALLWDDFVEMTRDEMKAYYGVDHVPDVPADIKPWKDERCGIYRRNGGTGEVYFDTDTLNYSNDDFTRTVHLEVAKGGFPFYDCVAFEPEYESSVIGGNEVMLGKTEDGTYYAEFTYKNAGFVLNACGVTQDEFVDIIASILE